MPLIGDDLSGPHPPRRQTSAWSEEPWCVKCVGEIPPIRAVLEVDVNEYPKEKMDLPIIYIYIHCMYVYIYIYGRFFQFLPSS